MKHKRKGERKATILNKKFNEEVNVNSYTSPYPNARICSVSVQVSDLQLEDFWDCQKNLLCFKKCFSFHLLTVCPQFMDRDNAAESFMLYWWLSC